MYFWLLLEFATNITQRLKTGFVVQGHILVCFCSKANRHGLEAPKL